MITKLQKNFPDPPTIAERMDHAQTRQAKMLTANMHILSCRIKSEIPDRSFRTWESPKLSGMGPFQNVLDAMRQDEATFEQTDAYVLKELAPWLFDIDRNGVL